MPSTPKTKSTPVAKPTSGNAISVVVKLNPADHKSASLAALSCHETVNEWIAGLVNTALMP
jgi:predicted HicB family RNase H-like nuclease